MINIIKERLTAAFSPDYLEVTDDSAKHIGHPGSAGGGGHYTVKIKAKSFENKTRLEVHREIYAVLNDLIPHKIHALQIQIIHHCE